MLLSAAVGGKGADACVGAFGLDNTYTGSNGWKLTLKDAYNETTNPTGIKAPTNVSVTQRNTGLDDVAAAAGAGGTMDLTSGHYTSSWSNPVIAYDAQAITEGRANYVSAVAKDGSGNLVNYAKISGNMSETNKAIDINSATSTLADGEYTMYVYAEQANGDKETDYASELSEGYAIHKGTITKNEGVLTAAYADKGLTASLGNNFKLGFESAKYDTKVTVGTGNGEVFGGTTIAELNANENTTVTGFVNAETAAIATDKQITTNGAFVSDKFVALGKGAVVNSTATNSVALGSGSVADEANTISVGAAGTERKIVNVASGGPLTANGTNAANIGDIFGETRVDADKNYVKAANTAAENLVALDTAIGAKQSGTYIAEANSVNTNLKALDTQVKTNTDAITALTGGSAEFKANTVEITTSGEVASSDKKAVSGSKLYAELRNGADGSYISKDTATASNLKALDAALKPIDDVVAANNYNSADIAKAEAAGATAVGWGNVAGGERSTAVGFGNIVEGSGSGAFGDPNKVYADGSYAIGNDNEILKTETSGGNTFAIGSGNYVKADNTFVLGSSVGTAEKPVMANNSVILGNGSMAEEDNVVSVGAEGKERKIIHVADGTIAEGSKEAVNGGQVYKLVEQSVTEETLRAQTAERYLQSEISANSQEIREVGAISAALAGLHYVEPSGEEGDKLVGAVAYGGYRGASAEAIGLAYKPNPNMMLSASTSISNGNDSQNAYNVGFSLKFGKGNTMATRAELRKQVQFVNEENRVLKNQIVNLSAENAEQTAKMAAQDEVIRKLLERVEKLENNGAKPAPVFEQKQPVKTVQPRIEQTKAEQPKPETKAAKANVSQKPETKTAVVQKPVSGKNIQVFSSARRSDSQRLADKLSAKGYDAFVGEGVVKGRTYYRTFVDDGDNPQAVLRQLKAAGINGFIFK
ncbi:MAG: SPOR domain-containing protein [Synergistaceae bacterium]|nr:SPOR domain-containing protein [Candidatus Equadaptatus faecalis]